MWPKVETGSEFAWREQMNVRSISASISVTITYIWTKFGTALKYNTINTPEWSNSHNLKIQDGGRSHLGFLGYVKRKMSITPDLIKISASMHWTLAYTTAYRRTSVWTSTSPTCVRSVFSGFGNWHESDVHSTLSPWIHWCTLLSRRASITVTLY